MQANRLSFQSFAQLNLQKQLELCYKNKSLKLGEGQKHTETVRILANSNIRAVFLLWEAMQTRVSLKPGAKGTKQLHAE